MVTYSTKAGKMDFKVGGGGRGEGLWNTERYCRPPLLIEKKIFQILDAVEWLKQSYFDLGDSLLIVSAALEPFLSSLCLPFFFLLCKKMGGHGPLLPPVLPALSRT